MCPGTLGLIGGSRKAKKAWNSERGQDLVLWINQLVAIQSDPVNYPGQQM